MTTIESRYLNTDFDLKSESAFDTLRAELAERCLELHYQGGEDGHHHASYESKHDYESSETGAEFDILRIVEVLKSLSDQAKSELQSCYLREFNIGFDCGDTWGFGHSVPQEVIAEAADLGCSLAVTLYPTRHPDGKPRE